MLWDIILWVFLVCSLILNITVVDQSGTLSLSSYLRWYISTSATFLGGSYGITVSNLRYCKLVGLLLCLILVVTSEWFLYETRA